MTFFIQINLLWAAPVLYCQFYKGGCSTVYEGVIALYFLSFRYRHEFKSQQLWVEIKFVLDNFANPLTGLLNVSYLLNSAFFVLSPFKERRGN